MANWISKDLEDVGFFKRFFIIELPHLCMLGAMTLFIIFGDMTPDRPISDSTATILSITLIVSLIVIFATIPYKNKVKRLKGFKWEWKKPWTWFVSYTARIFHAGLCIYPWFYMVYYSLIILKKILPFIFGILFSAAASSRGGSSYSSSSSSSSSGDGSSAPKKQYYYCEYCGEKDTIIKYLTSQRCTRHPNGHLQGNHKLYEGSEKSVYFCKYCGYKDSNMKYLTSQRCTRHPNGHLQGNHSPAL